jgi:DNA adenine methylase
MNNDIIDNLNKLSINQEKDKRLDIEKINKNVIKKPFLKWVGGKSQILLDVLKYFPENINNYHEPFLGGGSILLAVLSLQKENLIKIKEKIYAYDINKNLIDLFNNVKNNPNELLNKINNYKEKYNSINDTLVIRKPNNIEDSLTSKESYYYWLRKKFNDMDKNKESLEASALFLFLNKTCFRGIYREGPNGFNVPFGNYKNLNIIDENNLIKISELIKEVIFECKDYSEIFKNVVKDDFIYFDPPYVKINNKSFVNYTHNGFSKENHDNLFSKIKNLNDNVKFLLSNAKVDYVLEVFKEYKYESIKAKRLINSKNPKSKTIEVLIYN